MRGLGVGVGVAIIVSWAGSAVACSIFCAVSLAPGPRSGLERILVIPVGLIVVWAFVQAVRYTLRPGEQASEHIKWRILEEDRERR